MANDCFASLHLCRVRVTRLTQLGNVAAGPNNAYVSDMPISIGVTPVISQGSDSELRGGCDCIIASRKGNDILKRFTLQLDLGVLEPGLLEMLTGGTAVLDGDGHPIGVWWPSGISCSDPQQPLVAVEGWQDLWEDDHQATVHPYLHWIWPASRWTIGAHTLQNDFLQPQLNGETQANPNWGEGPYNDLPEAAGPLGGPIYSDTIPDAFCDYITAGVS